jgi:hypothetical protein
VRCHASHFADDSSKQQHDILGGGPARQSCANVVMARCRGQLRLKILNGGIAPITVIQRSPVSAPNQAFRQARLVTEMGGGRVETLGQNRAAEASLPGCRYRGEVFCGLASASIRAADFLRQIGTIEFSHRLGGKRTDGFEVSYCGHRTFAPEEWRRSFATIAEDEFPVAASGEPPMMSSSYILAHPGL